VVEPLEPWPLEIVEHETHAAVGSIELLHAPPAVPLRLELGQKAPDLAEVHPIRPRVRAAVLRVLDARSGDDLLDDLGQLTDAIVLPVMAYVERLVVDYLAGRGQNGQERA